MFDPVWAQRPFIPIATERLLLRPLEEADTKAFTPLLNDIRISERLMRVPFPYSLEDAHAFFGSVQKQFSEAESIVLAILDRKTNEFMGICSLEEELGFWLGHPYWGKGYGSEAIEALVHFAFDSLKLPVLLSRARKTNIGSRRIHEKIGFRETGMKECFSKATQKSDTAVTFQLTREEYFHNLYEKQLPIVWVVAAALIDEEGQLLLAQRPEGKVMAGIWELPGGKIEDGETPEGALARELYEELHIDVLREGLEAMTFASYHYHTFHLVMPLFICRRWKGEPMGKEGQDLRWIEYEDLSGIPTPSADINLFHKLARFLKESGI